ncbi:efflux RND transporter permease subunit [Sulfurospirillum barnesii]|uniref:Cation/multidrug efflux pump n=1 Tax=Sulfurospirillum barnesii (strain ATCC 700032 / DSM 10660 / SES-3) TaxID=760154 RepID=I3XYR2_SULBS|nr:efflux RND transporter permease subunit [Sulfurospirillum barnesii]AFL69086.1 cation/multidrug efflux pump [Sulfurospirillum barnesii SES-3]
MQKEPNSFIAWLVKNKVTANILMLIFLVGGVYMSLYIKKEVFPEFDLDMVTISVAYPGASPEEVEQGIVLSIEEEIRSIEGVKEVTATAKEGVASVIAELHEKGNKNRTYQDIQQAIDSITTFPEDAEKPVISMSSRKRRVVSLAIMGEGEPLVLRELAEIVRERLLQSSGISQVELVGARNYEVEIALDRVVLERYGLSMQNVSDIIAKESVELSGGNIKSNAGDILLRVKTRKIKAADFETLPILTTPLGATVRLGEIATIKDTFVDDSIFFTYNNKPAIEIEVYRLGDETPKSVSQATKKVVEEITQELPSAYALQINDDNSEVYNARLELLLKNGMIGLVLVLLILGAFLEFKLAFWVALGVPTSFLGSLLFLEYFGVSINMISMFAFILALGIVVDDAIIVGENIYEYKQRGMNYIEAAIQGTKDVAIPVTFSILTNIVAFLPLMFIPGIFGKTFFPIAIVVATVFAISWIEAILILPAHLAFKQTTKKGSILHTIEIQQQKVARSFDRFVEKVYQPFLLFCMRNRYPTLVMGFAILIVVLAYAKSGRLGFEMMPRIESNRAVVYATMPIGTPQSVMQMVNQQIIASGLKTIETLNEEGLNQGYKSKINENEIQVTFYLLEGEIRNISTSDFNDLWRKTLGKIAGIESLVFKKDIGGPGGGKAALTLELSHRDTALLEAAAQELADVLKSFSITKDVDDGISTGKRQIDFELLPLGQKLGLTAYEIARQVRYTTYGKEAIREQQGRNEVKIMVRQTENERNSEAIIDDIKIKTPSGGFVRLGDVAKRIEGNAYTKISRREGKRIINVTANVEPERDTPQLISSLDTDFIPKLQQKYPELQISYQGRQAETKESSRSLISSFLLVLAVLYIMLAIPFASYTQPLIIMIAIPFGIIGAFLGHMLLGYSLSMVSILGVVALCGVVVNDTLVMVDYANTMRKEGHKAFEAIILAATRRFRPIFLTTATTFGGLAPMIYETSIQAKFMIPMAISLGYGILFSTLISLIFVPALYIMLEDIKALFQPSHSNA